MKSNDKVFWSIRLLLCFGLMLSSTSCLEKIDLEVPAGFGESLAIQARLVKGEPSIITMRVSQLFDFTAASLQPVNVREHFLVDEEGNKFELDELGNGLYQGILDDSSPIVVDYGRSYKLQVSTFDNRRYETTFETLYPVPKAEEIQTKMVVKDVVNLQGEYETREELQFLITTPVKNQSGNAGVLWELERTFKVTDTPVQSRVLPKSCYITETIGKGDIKVIDPTEVVSDKVVDFPLFETPIDYRFAQGFYFSAIQYSLSKGAFEYWNNVKQLLRRTGNMFEAPAGKIQTNFYNVDEPEDEIFGYFYVTEADTLHFGIDSLQLGPIATLCPPNTPPAPGGECPFILTCCNCLSQPRSTTVQPDFWKF